LTGVQANGAVGSVISVYWKPIDDSQTANWQNISSTQAAGWAVINDSENANWVLVETTV
jgi:hypothetical protein